jgi:L-iditol 2-dehydrogenase
MSEIPSSMAASVLLERQRIALERRAVPRPEDDQVLVEVSAVGVCGSDVHFWHEGALGEWTVREPLVLGHESAGRIVAVGDRVPRERIGERVSIEPQRPEPWSAETLNGRYNLDPAMRFFATPGVDGAFAQYVAIQSHFAWRVPDSMSDEAAALLEPLSVAIATIEKAGTTVGHRVLIAGAGPIGIAVAQVARAYGAREILVSDVDEQRRRQALTFGATAALAPGEVVEALQVDSFIDASGAASAVRSGIGAVRPAGRVVLVGMGAPEIAVPVSVIQNRELVVTGVFRYANTWPAAIALVESGAVDLDRMVTGHFGLSEVEAALESAGRPGILKSVVHPQR